MVFGDKGRGRESEARKLIMIFSKYKIEVKIIEGVSDLFYFGERWEFLGGGWVWSVWRFGGGDERVLNKCLV